MRQRNGTAEKRKMTKNGAGHAAGQRPDMLPDGRTAAGQGTTPRRARSEKKSHQSPEVAPAHRFEGAAVFLRAGPAMKTARFGASFFEIKPVFLKQFLKVRGPDARAALKAAQTGYPF